MPLNYVTTADSDTEIHLQEARADTALCDLRTPHPVEPQVARSGLKDDHMVMCLECMHTAPNRGRGYTTYGFHPADWANAEVQAAARVLDQSHDGAVMLNGVTQAREGFMVQPRVGGGVIVTHLSDEGMVTGDKPMGEEEADEWRLTILAYEWSLFDAGWVTTWRVKSDDWYSVQAVPGHQARI